MSEHVHVSPVSQPWQMREAQKPWALNEAYSHTRNGSIQSSFYVARGRISHGAGGPSDPGPWTAPGKIEQPSRCQSKDLCNGPCHGLQRWRQKAQLVETMFTLPMQSSKASQMQPAFLVRLLRRNWDPTYMTPLQSGSQRTL